VEDDLGGEGLHGGVEGGGSRMSPRMSSTTALTRAVAKRLGSVEGRERVAADVAPLEASQRASHPPLKPVWPVRKTLRPCQEEDMVIRIACGVGGRTA
jgi:hypothetical protein